MSNGQLAGPRILVVEREARQARALEELLQERGFEIAGPCATVSSALDQVRACPPAAAVVGLKLKDGSADYLLLELEAAGVPVVAVTGRHDPGHARYRDLPSLSSPVGRDDLSSVVQQALWASSVERRRRARRAHIPKGAGRG